MFCLRRLSTLIGLWISVSSSACPLMFFWIFFFNASYSVRIESSQWKVHIVVYLLTFHGRFFLWKPLWKVSLVITFAESSVTFAGFACSDIFRKLSLQWYVLPRVTFWEGFSCSDIRGFYFSSAVTLLKTFPVVTFSRRFCIEWHLEGFPGSDICRRLCLGWRFWKAFPESDICRRLCLGWHFWKAFPETDICRRLCLWWHFWKTFPVLIFVGFARGDITGRQDFALGDIWKAFFAVIFVEGFAWSDIFGRLSLKVMLAEGFCLGWHFWMAFPVVILRRH